MRFKKAVLAFSLLLLSIPAWADPEDPKSNAPCSEVRSPAQDVEKSISGVRSVFSSFSPVISSAASKVAGVLSAQPAVMVSSSILYPLEQLKMRMQFQPKQSPAKSLMELVHQGYGMPTSPGVGSYFKNNVYKGLGPYLAQQSVSTGLIYSLQDTFKKQKWTGNETADSILAGGAASLTSNAVSIPLSNYRTKQSLSDLGDTVKYTPKSFIQAAIKNPSVATKGLGMAVPASGAVMSYFALYDQFKKLSQKDTGKKEGSDYQLFSNFLASAAARGIVAVGYHPFDSVKVGMQKTGKGYVETFRGLANQGITRPFKGISVGLPSKALASGLSMGLYELLKKMWGNENPGKE